MKVNLSAIQEDIRRIAVALFLAVAINALINDGAFIDNFWPIIFSIITWCFGIIEVNKPTGGEQ